MMTDSLADMLTRIRNALMMKHEQVTLPYSQLKEAVAKILAGVGYLRSCEVVGSGVQKALVLQLKYLSNGVAAITRLSRVSKPSRRVYLGYQDLKGKGMGIQILSTAQGILSDGEARQKKVGGEILLEVY